MENTSQLISDYLDGELDDAGVARLAELLRSDPAVVDQLVVDSFVHSQLHHWMNVRQLRDELLADAFGGDGCSLGPMSAEVEFTADVELELARAEVAADSQSQPSQAAVGRSRRNWLGFVAGLATMLLIAASIFTAAYLVARPAIVAQLTQDSNCQWEAGSNHLPVGSLLQAGQPLKLKSGRALLTLSSGVQVVLVGPSTAKLVSSSRVELELGRVGAQVPTQAIGFTVATPIADFVDLGTEFSLALEASHSCELQVFDGLVELRLPQHAGHDEERLRISEGSAVRFDAATFDVASIPYDEEQRIAP